MDNLSNVYTRDLSDLLVMVANPDWLPPKDRLIPRGKRFEDLDPNTQEIIYAAVASKLESARTDRDSVLEGLVSNTGIQRARSRTIQVSNYSELYQLILGSKVMTPSVKKVVAATERRWKREFPEMVQEDLNLTELLDVNRGRFDSPTWQQRWSSDVELNVRPTARSSNDFLYFQGKDKTAKKLADKVERMIREEEERSVLSIGLAREAGIPCVSPAPELKNIRIDDIFGFMLVTMYGMQISTADGRRTVLFANPRKPHDTNTAMDRAFNYLRGQEVTVTRRRVAENFYAPVSELGITDKYRDPNERINAIQIYLRGRISGETISVYLKDIFNALEDEIGIRAHGIYDHRHSPDRKDYSARVNDFLIELKRWYNKNFVDPITESGGRARPLFRTLKLPEPHS